MLQMLVESGHSVSQYTLQSGQSTTRWQPAAIEKTPRVMQALGEHFMQADSLLSPSAINKYMRCPLQFYYCYAAGLREPDLPEDELELDNRIFGNIFHEAADIIYHQLPHDISRELIDHLLKSKIEIERAVDEAFHKEMPCTSASGLHLINREVIIHYLRQLLEIDRRLAPFTILGLECDVYRNLSRFRLGGRIDRLDLMNDGTIRVVDYKTGSKQVKPLPDVDAIFLPENISKHADYYLQTFVYADIVRRQRQSPVAPALLFIQHAGAEGYDPVLKLGKEPVRDIAEHSARFNELLEQKVEEIFSPERPFEPTSDLTICRTCPYAPFCRR